MDSPSATSASGAMELQAAALRHHQAGRSDEALAAMRRLIDRFPGSPEHYNTFGVILASTAGVAEAIAAFQAALRLAPDHLESRVNLAAALRDSDQSEEAAAQCAATLSLRPGFAPAHNALGTILEQQCRPAEALDAFRQAVQLAPGYAEARLNLAMALLLLGDFEHGWAEYEWRWQPQSGGAGAQPGSLAGLAIQPTPAPALVPPNPRRWSKPRWDGSAEPLASRTLLLHAEGGLGNAIQFTRYAPHLARRLAPGGTRVLVECHAALKPLMLSLEGVAGVYAFGEALPPFDRFAPLASLPLILRHFAEADVGAGRGHASRN